MSQQSNRNVVLITGATGHVGMATIRALSSQDVQIRALVIDKQAKEVQELSSLPNVKVVQGNFENEQQLDEALQDVGRALLVCPNVSNQIQMEKNFINAAKKKNLELLVKVSILSPESMVSKESDVSFAKCHAEVEECLSKCGLNHIILRPNFFFENVLWFRDEIMKERSISVPCPSIPATMLAVEDLGNIAASLLSGKKQMKVQGGKVLDICGPESISFEQIAKHLSKRLGQDIRVKEIDSDTLIKNLQHIELSEEMRKGLKPIFDHYWSQGKFNCQVSHKDLPVTPSTTFDQWLQRNLKLFQEESSR